MAGRCVRRRIVVGTVAGIVDRGISFVEVIV
jgi:hypothetical protein